MLSRRQSTRLISLPVCVRTGAWDKACTLHNTLVEGGRRGVNTLTGMNLTKQWGKKDSPPKYLKLRSDCAGMTEDKYRYRNKMEIRNTAMNEPIPLTQYLSKQHRDLHQQQLFTFKWPSALSLVETVDSTTCNDHFVAADAPLSQRHTLHRYPRDSLTSFIPEVTNDRKRGVLTHVVTPRHVRRDHSDRLEIEREMGVGRSRLAHDITNGGRHFTQEDAVRPYLINLDPKDRSLNLFCDGELGFERVKAEREKERYDDEPDNTAGWMRGYCKTRRRERSAARRVCVKPSLSHFLVRTERRVGQSGAGESGVKADKAVGGVSHSPSRHWAVQRDSSTVYDSVVGEMTEAAHSQGAIGAVVIPSGVSSASVPIASGGTPGTQPARVGEEMSVVASPVVRDVVDLELQEECIDKTRLSVTQLVLTGRAVKVLWQPAWPNLVARIGAGVKPRNLSPLLLEMREHARVSINGSGTLITIMGTSAQKVERLALNIMRTMELNVTTFKGAHPCFFRILKVTNKKRERI